MSAERAEKLQALQVALLSLATSLASEPSASARQSILQGSTPLFSTLRSASRDVADEVRSSKTSVAEARAGVDAERLALQNLRYERTQLDGEIRSCNRFRSIYTEVPLQPLEEFLDRAPEDLKEEGLTSEPHRLQLARLEFELRERQRLEGEKEALQASRAKLSKENAESKARLEKLDRDLRAMLAAGRELEARLAAEF